MKVCTNCWFRMTGECEEELVSSIHADYLSKHCTYWVYDERNQPAVQLDEPPWKD